MKDIFLLDLDDTLLDFRRAERANLKKSLKQAGVPVKEALLSRFHEINDFLWKALERGEIDRERLKGERFKLLFEEFGISRDADAAAKYYFENFPFVCYPFAGAKKFLRELSRRGRVYLVTNGGAEIQRRHILKAGFSPYLVGVFLSEEVGFPKPSAQFAQYVEAHIPQFSAERAVWIGDSLTSDGACAKRAGIRFILFSKDGPPKGYAGDCAKTYEELLGRVGTL